MAFPSPSHVTACGSGSCSGSEATPSSRLTVAEVRTALFSLRHAWYERTTPDGPPFLFSDAATEELSMAEFGCVFDYGQHVKRHQRLVRSGGTASASQAKAGTRSSCRGGGVAGAEPLRDEAASRQGGFGEPGPFPAGK